MIDVTGESAPVRLTTTVVTGVINQMASWSPDGTQIAFMSTREPGNYPSVFVMNADGSGQVDLTPKPAGETGPWSSRAPAWSPACTYIYFTGVRPNLTTEQIYVMGVDGSNQTLDIGRRECRGNRSARAGPGGHATHSHTEHSVAAE